MPRLASLLSGLLIAAGLGLISGCVSTQVVSHTTGAKLQPVDAVLIVVQGGNFKQNNTASNLAEKNLKTLLPSLIERLPAVFAINGIPARAEGIAADPGAPQPTLPLSGPEKVLWVTPVSATYSSRTGQELFVQARLMDGRTPIVLWKAEIRLATLGFGKFDNALANEVGVKLLTQMREDGLTRLATGPLRSE